MPANDGWDLIQRLKVKMLNYIMPFFYSIKHKCEF